MHAVAHQALNRNPSCRITYVSCEKFTNEFIRAIQENTLTKFRARYRSVDYLLIDDIQFLAGKERIQEEFFHTFNEIYEAQKADFFLHPIVQLVKLTRLKADCFQDFNGD